MASLTRGVGQRDAVKASRDLYAVGQGAKEAVGPIVLKPKTSRIGMLIGITCMAVFWNGIVSVFVWQVIESWRSGHADWFLTLFMIPFVLAIFIHSRFYRT